MKQNFECNPNSVMKLSFVNSVKFSYIVTSENYRKVIDPHERMKNEHHFEVQWMIIKKNNIHVNVMNINGAGLLFLTERCNICCCRNVRKYKVN